MFLNGVLFKSEVWQGLDATDLTMLQTVDHQMMRVIRHNAHSKKLVEFLYLETTAQPFKYIISARRVMYLHNIFIRNSEELVRGICEALKSTPTKEDFFCLVKSAFEQIGENLNQEKIMSMSKIQFKTHIKKLLNQLICIDLKFLQNRQSKVRDIKYPQFRIQPYLTSHTFTNEIASMLVKMRSSMTKNFKSNFTSMHRHNLNCQMKCQDKNTQDSQSHLLQCEELLQKLSVEELTKTKSVNYKDIFDSLEKQREVTMVLTRLLEIREERLEENLPVGPQDLILQ